MKFRIMHKIVLILLTTIFFSGFYYYHTITIHIIRHGEKIIEAGVSDAPLTDNGKIQAEKLGKYLSNKKHISHIYASPMRRTRQTAEIIAAQTGSFILFDDLLREKNYKKSSDLYPDGTYIYVKSLHNEQKETIEQHLERSLKFFQKNIGLLDKELYIVGHGGFINKIFKIAADAARPTEKRKIGYCSIFSFKYNKITKSFTYIDNFELHALNDNNR